MSRIYEALARANDVVVEPEPTAFPSPAVTALEQYAHEGRHAFVGRPMMRPVPPPLPAARRRPLPVNVPTQGFDGKVMDGSTVNVMAADQYATLATVLHQTQLDSGLKTLLVTSATPQEGKTLTVVNLAITLSDSYARRVLIVDADLRRPSVHRALWYHRGPGSERRAGRPGGELPIVQISQQLSVLPAGRPDPNPLARLSHDRHSAGSRGMRGAVRLGPGRHAPLGIGADAQLLARFVQGVIFVIRAGAAPYHVLERAVAQLGRESIIGTVLNGVEEAAVPVASTYDPLESTS